MAIESAYKANIAPDVVKDVVDLLNRYMPWQKDAVVFLESQYVTETSILAGCTNRLRISEPLEDTLSVSLMEPIMQYSHGLKTNDVVVLTGNPNVFQHPSLSYALYVRLEPINGDISPYCLSIQRMEPLVIK